MLYFRKTDNGYVYIFQEYDEARIPRTLEFLMNEIAIMLIYPDGYISIVPVGNVGWHMECYQELFKTTERFARVIRDLKLYPEIADIGSTYKVDCKLAQNGIISIHNHNLMSRSEYEQFLKEERPYFRIHTPEEKTDKQKEILDVIYSELCDDYCEIFYNEKTGRLESVKEENKEKKL